MEIEIVLLPGAIMPKYQTNNSAGMDLHANESFIFQPNEVKAINTGVQMAIPLGFEGQIRTRSGMAMKEVIVLNSPGTIDADFRGEIKVILKNLSNINFEIISGMRIAQIIFSKVESCCFQEVSFLSETSRGQGGFGSTGF